jgi:hypothetical protein
VFLADSLPLCVVLSPSGIMYIAHVKCIAWRTVQVLLAIIIYPPRPVEANFTNTCACGSFIKPRPNCDPGIAAKSRTGIKV